MEKEQKVIVFDTGEKMCRKVAEEIRNDLLANPEQMLCAAAGNTSLRVFEELIGMFERKEIDFSKAYFVAMDEWLGMNEETEGSCGNFLIKHFLGLVNYTPDHVRLWNGKMKDTGRECREVESFIKSGKNQKIDYLVLGCGMNGHLALNEPGTAFTARSHVTALDEITRRTGQKYFEKEVVLDGGITLGMDNFREAGRTVLLLSGIHKAKIAAEILKRGQPDPEIPATAIYDFPAGSIYLDRDSAGFFTSQKG